MKYFDRFHPSSHYHVFNHAVGTDNLFRSQRDYASFLARFQKHVSPVCNTLSYCLMPNHFHFLLQVKKQEELINLRKGKQHLDPDFHKSVMQPFSNFLNGYAKSYNQQYRRKGALFIDYSRRIEIPDDLSILSVMKYIHLNPVTHGFCDDPAQWPYSSYLEILNEDWPSFVDREAVKAHFGGLQSFIDLHRTP